MFSRILSRKYIQSIYLCLLSFRQCNAFDIYVFSACISNLLLSVVIAKECSNYRTIALISHASKVMLKILQARLQQFVNCELPVVQDGFRKGRGTRDQIANICWIIEKAREFQKNIYLCFIDYAKAFDCVWITINCGKFWKRWKY